jgi:phospholipid/cholesterol/gamma-HCH transport system substrate-binding protein
MNKQRVGMLLGIFVAGVIAGFSMAPAEENDTQMFAGSYTITARFENVGGLKERSPVRASGVVIGQVAAIHFNNKEYIAEVEMAIDSDYQFPVDTSASILTVGFSGEQYINLMPGAERRILKDDDVIDLTESAMVLEHIISQFIYSKRQ